MAAGTAGARWSAVDTSFWYLLAYDNGEPVGAACVTEYPLDTMVFASPLAHRVVSVVRRVFPRYLKFRVTWCGLPISTAGSNLRVVAGIDVNRVVSAINEAVEAISCERKTWLVVYKELDSTEALRSNALKDAGFVQAESLPMNRIAHRFANFDALLGRHAFALPLQNHQVSEKARDERRCRGADSRWRHDRYDLHAGAPCDVRKGHPPVGAPPGSVAA